MLARLNSTIAAREEYAVITKIGVPTSQAETDVLSSSVKKDAGVATAAPTDPHSTTKTEDIHKDAPQSSTSDDEDDIFSGLPNLFETFDSEQERTENYFNLKDNLDQAGKD